MKLNILHVIHTPTALSCCFHQIGIWRSFLFLGCESFRKGSTSLFQVEIPQLQSIESTKNQQIKWKMEERQYLEHLESSVYRNGLGDEIKELVEDVEKESNIGSNIESNIAIVYPELESASIQTRKKSQVEQNKRELENIEGCELPKYSNYDTDPKTGVTGSREIPLTHKKRKNNQESSKKFLNQKGSESRKSARSKHSERNQEKTESLLSYSKESTFDNSLAELNRLIEPANSIFHQVMASTRELKPSQTVLFNQKTRKNSRASSKSANLPKLKPDAARSTPRTNDLLNIEKKYQEKADLKQPNEELTLFGEKPPLRCVSKAIF